MTPIAKADLTMAYVERHRDSDYGFQHEFEVSLYCDLNSFLYCAFKSRINESVPKFYSIYNDEKLREGRKVRSWVVLLVLLEMMGSRV